MNLINKKIRMTWHIEFQLPEVVEDVDNYRRKVECLSFFLFIFSLLQAGNTNCNNLHDSSKTTEVLASPLWNTKEILWENARFWFEGIDFCPALLYPDIWINLFTCFNFTACRHFWQIFSLFWLWQCLLKEKGYVLYILLICY